MASVDNDTEVSMKKVYVMPFQDQQLIDTEASMFKRLGDASVEVLAGSQEYGSVSMNSEKIRRIADAAAHVQQKLQAVTESKPARGKFSGFQLPPKLLVMTSHIQGNGLFTTVVARAMSSFNKSTWKCKDAI